MYFFLYLLNSRIFGEYLSNPLFLKIYRRAGIFMPTSKTVIRQHAIYCVAETLNEKKTGNLTKKDIYDLSNHDKSSGDFSIDESIKLNKLYWKIFYDLRDHNGKEFGNEIQDILRILSNPQDISEEKALTEYNPFNWIEQEPYPENIDLPSNFDNDLPPNQIESMLNFARFLYKAKFRFEDKNKAIHFVYKLMQSNFLQEATRDSFKSSETREKFDKLLAILKNGGNIGIDVWNTNQTSSEQSTNQVSDQSMQKNIQREKRYQELATQVIQLLSTKIKIPAEYDDFMLKLVFYPQFQKNIFKMLPQWLKPGLINILTLLRENELSKD